MLRHLHVVVATAALAGLGGAAMGQSAIGNASFDAPFLGQQAPTAGNWASFLGGAPILMAEVDNSACGCTIVPRTGSSALYLRANGGGTSFVGVQQPLTGIQPGVSYTMKIWARAAGNINNAVEYRFEWKNAAGAFIGDQFALTTRIDASLTSTYQQFQLTAVAPADAAGVNLVLDIQTWAFNPLNPVFDTEVFIDDVEFVATPLSTQAACCFSDGTCQVALLGACPAGSSQLAAGTTCSPNLCPPPVPTGACCNPATSACAFTLATTCTSLGGSFRGASTTCTAGACAGVHACRGDFNNSGGLEVQDIFDFLNAWFAGCP